MQGSPVGLTQRGWTLLGAAIGLVIGSRALGSDALAVPGLAGLLVLALALAVVARSTMAFDATRVVEPARPQAGDQVTVHLTATLVRGRPLGFVEMTEAAPGDRQLRLALGRLSPGEPAAVAYSLAATRRGRHRLGPLTVSMVDPLGLAARAFVACRESDVVVRPRVDTVRVGPAIGAPRLGTSAARAAGTPTAAAGELAALRLYEQGDDLRRVHWRSTARQDELVVRQDEAAPWDRVTVLLDTRAGVHDEQSFEAAVSACASLVTALHRAGRPCAARTTGGLQLGVGVRGGLDAMLDGLAAVQTDTSAIDGVAWGTAALVAVTGACDPAIARLVSGPRRRDAVLVVTRDAGTTVPAPWVRVVDARRAPFAEAWNRTVPRWRSTAS